ncbi:MAG: hypothetical protein ACRCZB_09375 [Bacteroidales bacterium]
MTANEIKEIIEIRLYDASAMSWVYSIMILVLVLAITYCMQALMLKKQRISMQESIAELGQELDSLKETLENIQTVEQQKRALKYDALLNSLNLIDAHLSHTLSLVEKQRIDKQYASTEEARTCYNNLTLSCDNMEILKFFSTIMFDAQSRKTPEQQTALLSKYRKMVRKELGFNTGNWDEDEKVWIRYVLSEQNKTNV